MNPNYILVSLYKNNEAIARKLCTNDEEARAACAMFVNNNIRPLSIPILEYRTDVSLFNLLMMNLNQWIKEHNMPYQLRMDQISKPAEELAPTSTISPMQQALKGIVEKIEANTLHVWDGPLAETSPVAIVSDYDNSEQDSDEKTIIHYNGWLDDLKSLSHGMKEPGQTAEIFEVIGTYPQVYTDIEMHPCRVMARDTQEQHIEQCDESEAEFYSIYLRKFTGGLECVADCPTKEAGKQLLSLLNTVRYIQEPTPIRTKLLLQMQGGLVQAIYANRPMEILKVDYDLLKDGSPEPFTDELQISNPDYIAPSIAEAYEDTNDDQLTKAAVELMRKHDF